MGNPAILALEGASLKGMRCLRVRPSAAAMTSLKKTFEDERNRFEGLEKINHTEAWQPEEDECLVLQSFELPDSLKEAVVNLHALPELAPASGDSLSLRVLVYVHDYGSGVIKEALFQSMYKSSFLQQKRTFFLTEKLLEFQEAPVLALRDSVDARYISGRLEFQSWRSIGRFCDTSPYYKEATDDEVREMLKHERLDTGDLTAALANCGQRLRRKVAMIVESKVLDALGPRQVKDAAKRFQLDVQLRRVGGVEKVVVPLDKKDFVRFVQILNEECFNGCLSNRPFVTNSKRSIA